MTLNASSQRLLDPTPVEGGNGGTTTTTEPPASATTLTPDQQKIASAVEKVAAAEPSPAPRTSTTPKITKPLVPTGVPDDVLKINFGMDDNDVLSTLEQEQEVPVKKEGEKKVEPKVEAKVEPKKDEKAPTEDGIIRPKAAQQRQQQQQQQPDSRDYNGFDAETVAALKRMPNESYNVVHKQLREFEQLKQQKVGSYLQHPQAYTLSPEYAQASAMVGQAEYEIQHYEQQLLNIRAGKDWTVLTGFDQKTGQPIVSPAQKASDESDIRVANTLSQLSQQAEQFRRQRSDITANFQKRIEAENQMINQVRAQRFGWVADPKTLDDTVEVVIKGTPTPIPIKQVIADFKNLFPPHHHASPILDVAADMFVAMQIKEQENRELRSKTETQSRLREDSDAAEINVETASNGAPNKGETVFDMAGLED